MTKSMNFEQDQGEKERSELFTDKNPLPKVEPIVFILEDKKLSVIFEGERRQIVKTCIISNGLHDLCCCLDENGNVTVKETAKVDKKRILHIPTHDLWWITLKEPIVKKHSLILEIDDSVKKIVDEVVQIFGGEKGRDYDMCGGANYGHA